MLTLEQQVVSLELAKNMKELGFKQESLYWWSEHTTPATLWSESAADEQAIWDDERQYSAYTVGELGEFLKKENCSSGYSEEDVGWWCQSSLHDIYDVKEIDTEANARAKLAIYLAEKGLITLEQLPDVCKICYQNITDGNHHIEHQKDGTHLPVSPMYDSLAEKGLLDTKTLG